MLLRESDAVHINPEIHENTSAVSVTAAWLAFPVFILRILFAHNFCFGIFFSRSSLFAYPLLSSSELFVDARFFLSSVGDVVKDEISLAGDAPVFSFFLLFH